MVDHYLQDRSRLDGKPKRTIVDYVASNGVLVPKRFETIAEARRFSGNVLARSEHPQEYDGVSGLLRSFTLDNQTTDDEVLDKILEGSGAQKYCTLAGLDEDAFRREVSFSLWEKLGGFNRAVVADSSITGRYHVTTYAMHFQNYTIVENGVPVASHGKKLPNELSEGLTGLIEIYEKVRNLAKFDSNHCPIMEFQTADGKDFFLQYHRARDFEPASFKLEREIEEGEHEALFVRGVTPAGGKVYKTLVIKKAALIGGFGKVDFVEESEAATGIPRVFYEEFTLPRREVYFMEMDRRDNSCSFLGQLADNRHIRRSRIFKPSVSILVHEGVVHDYDEFREMRRRMIQTGEDQHVMMRVVSDGRKAYVKRLA